MQNLFENSDFLNSPIECFGFDTDKDCFPIRPHWHYFMEIIYITEGTAEMHSDDRTYFLGKGDMIIFHPKSVHSIYTANGSRLRYDVLKFDINRIILSSDYAPKLRSIFRSAEKKGAEIVFPSEFTAKAGIERIFATCIKEMRERKYGFDTVVHSGICELLISVLRRWQDSGFSVDSDAFAEDERYDIYNITEYIDEHISEGIQVSEIAERCGMSYSYFAKKFLSVYGKTCKEYIENMRLFKVEEFLLFTDFDLNYISQETGFSDCSHMIKSFKQSRGVTPKKFRNGERAEK